MHCAAWLLVAPARAPASALATEPSCAAAASRIACWRWSTRSMKRRSAGRAPAAVERGDRQLSDAALEIRCSMLELLYGAAQKPRVAVLTRTSFVSRCATKRSTIASRVSARSCASVRPLRRSAAANAAAADARLRTRDLGMTSCR